MQSKALLQLLSDAGCEVKRGKRISLRLPGQTRFKRLDSLGEEYGEEALRAVIAGERKHKAAKSRGAEKFQESVSLLIDIQAKLQQGKGAGYERWAKVFNLKQMAKALNYLTEHNLADYDTLVQKTEEATRRYNALSDEIKAKEARMAEIAKTKTHLLNYIKTRDVYVAYRKAGYSKKFLAEHESEILLHKAAKKAFDELGVAKLPSLKVLQSEYAELLEKKKRDYAAYRAARDEMRELLTVKANVDSILRHDALRDPRRDTPIV